MTTEQFADRVVGAIDSASLAILISIGHQTGLFDVLADLGQPTRRRSRSGRTHRTLRARMAGGRDHRQMVETTLRQDVLPARGPRGRAHSGRMARLPWPDFQYIPLLGSVEHKVMECFANGGCREHLRLPQLMAVSRATRPCLAGLLGGSSCR